MEQLGVMLKEEEGLKNWIAFFWRVTTCSLKDNISEENYCLHLQSIRKGTKLQNELYAYKEYEEIVHAT